MSLSDAIQILQLEERLAQLDAQALETAVANYRALVPSLERGHARLEAEVERLTAERADLHAVLKALHDKYQVRQGSTNHRLVACLKDLDQLLAGDVPLPRWQPIADLIASWRSQAEDESRDAARQESEGNSIYSNGHSGEAKRLTSCADALEKLLPAAPKENP